jgi:hypothetical protein
MSSVADEPRDGVKLMVASVKVRTINSGDLRIWSVRASTAGKLAIQIFAPMDKRERAVRSRAAATAYRAGRAQDGPRRRGHPGYGWRWASKTGDRKVADPEELAVMRRIVALREAGRSWYSIAAQLHSEGVVSPKTGREWSVSRCQRGYAAWKKVMAEGGWKDATNERTTTTDEAPARAD